MIFFPFATQPLFDHFKSRRVGFQILTVVGSHLALSMKRVFFTILVNLFPGVEDSPTPHLFPCLEVTNLVKEVPWTTPSRIAATMKTSSRLEMVSDIFQMTGDLL